MSFRSELEICAETLQACIAARNGGADRIELCSALSEGGLTPSHGFIQSAVAIGGLPVHVLLRPRGGNFVYTDVEFSTICIDLQHSLALGAAGVIAGILSASGAIDKDRVRTLVELGKGRQITFHRAFDHTRDMHQALEDLIAVGCTRVLTSGGKPTVAQGAGELDRLVTQAAGRIRIAAGGGVTLATALELSRIAGLDLHASLRGSGSSAPDRRDDPLWQQQREMAEISSEDVEALARILHSK